MGRIDRADPGPWWGGRLPGKCSRETLATLPINPSSPQEQTGAKSSHPVSVLPSTGLTGKETCPRVGVLGKGCLRHHQ